MKNLNVLIVEDEIPAQINLKKTLEKNFPDLRVIGIQSSVRGTVEWLSNPENHADIIFMDVELSDGMCFDIFAKSPVEGKVVITTAFDNYAVRAFRINSIDYLLKPVDPNELSAAVERCREAIGSNTPVQEFDIENLRRALSGGNREYKKRFVVKIGDRISILETDHVAYFYAEDKSTYLVSSDNHRYILDISLDAVSEQVDPALFFRLARNCTAAIRSIAGISKHLSNRLKISLDPRPEFEVFVSRSRTTDFMEWLEGK